jgi:D-glycero-alpha-D-manno-heptose-7-phosphate kinase
MNDNNRQKPLRVINSVAPIRVCDNGGWTDTWFAESGNIFNIGVYPYVEVQIEVYPFSHQAERIIIYAENYGQRYVMDTETDGWSHHPLLEATIELMQVPDDLAFQVTIFSEAPAGASTGTSAAVTVAMVGALDYLTPGRMTPHEVAYTAHAVETQMLKRQSGIQDQLCSAYGGVNYIDMHQYPHATVSQIQVPNAVWWELERRLCLVYLGKSHDSSQVHEKVIRELEDAGPNCEQLEALRATARQSRDAMYAGDLCALGRAMTNNTEAQGRLNPALVSADARRVIEIAREYDAIGWKVNGAGGDGGSVTLLCSALSHAQRAMIREIEKDNALFKHIPTYLSRYGLRIWEEVNCG